MAYYFLNVILSFMTRRYVSRDVTSHSGAKAHALSVGIVFSEDFSKISIFCVPAFALTFYLLGHLDSIYSNCKICRLFESRGIEVTYYIIVRLLRTFWIGLPADDRKDPVGSERQRLTLVLSSAGGCRVFVRRRT